mgnify:CR=1 FL=1
MRGLEQDLPLDRGVDHREVVWCRYDRLIDTDPLDLLHIVQLILVLVVLGLLFPELVVREGDEV